MKFPALQNIGPRQTTNMAKLEGYEIDVVIELLIILLVGRMKGIENHPLSYFIVGRTFLL